MKTFNYKRLFRRLAALALLPACFAVFSCKEDIDESNLYTFKGETIEDFLANRSDQFSNFNYILQRVGLDKRLSGYGTFTCFAPINEAVTAYVDSLYNDMSHEDLPHNGMTGPGLEGLTDSLCNDIAKFHIVDFKEYMAVDMSKNTTITTMLGRDLSTTTDTISGNTRVNTDAQIINLDNELENGVLHIIDHVITRSNNLVAGEMTKHPEQFSIFYNALELTGLVDSLGETKKNATYNVKNPFFYAPTECMLGYTIFVETNDVLKQNKINTIDDLVAFANNAYKDCAKPGTGWYDYARNHGIQVSTGNDYENPWNCLNMFVRYHIVKYRIPYDRLVYTGLNEASKEVGFYEYNETMLPFTLLKVYARTTTSDRMVNHWEMNSSLNENDSLEVDKISIHRVLSDGLTILLNNDYQQPLNGYIHRINGMLVYDEMVPSGLLNERLRFDDTALLPEMMNNSFRSAQDEYIRSLNGGIIGNDGANLGGDYIQFAEDYFDYLRIYNGDNTRFMYLPNCTNASWSNYQADELMAKGAYDFSMRLPPVPDGMYEIRMGYTANGNRGMVQMFLGHTPNVLQMKALDIPLDMRRVPSRTNLTSEANIATGWTPWTDETDKGVQTDKNMHNLGWMRGPLYYSVGRGGTIARSNEQDLRRIIARQQLEQGEYWLRFKTALPDNTNTQFHLDYIEIVPASIYNNPMYLEDMY